jgi:hypothetical protein
MLVDLPPELLKVVGRRRKGTESYYREWKTMDDEFQWYKALSEHFAVVDPGSASRLVGVSRNAVYKRIKAGTLTAFFFKAPKHRLTLTDVKRGKAIGKVSIKFRAHVNCLIPFKECEQWRKEIDYRRRVRKVAPFGGHGIRIYPPNFTVAVERYPEGTLATDVLRIKPRRGKRAK